MKKKNLLRNEQGFTLVEIIAVLILLGILAAVAVPRYMDLQDEARNSAAQAAISEVMGRLSTGYGIELLQGAGAQPVLANILTEGGMTSGSVLTSGDFTITPTAVGTDVVTIAVGTVQGVALVAAVVGTWNMP